ncbi:10350_t:CDS:1 [Cetraspora pellucida]|uniref:10350_t:CDS:1 n=1 Tax=Cetraspora pellucida TaxID=1433469 RepID=A0ACA9N4I7_9GLOM|nr:10350_t:CDS:1 [Cetraspora pellucida]
MDEYTNDNGGGGIGDHDSPTSVNNLTEDYFYYQQSNVHSLFSSVEKRGSSPEIELSESVMLATNSVGEPIFSLRNPEEYKGPEIIQRSLKGKLVEDSIINIDDEDMSSNEAGVSNEVGGNKVGGSGIIEDIYGDVFDDGGRKSISSRRLSNMGVIGNTDELLLEEENIDVIES